MEPEDLPVPGDYGHASTARWIIAGVALIALLHQARGFFVPLLLGILLSYTLRPVVELLARVRIPRVIGAALVLACVAGGLVSITMSLQSDAAAVIEQLPRASRTLSDALRSMRGPGGSPLARINEAARELEAAASVAAGDPAPAPPQRARPAVAVTQPSALVPAITELLRGQLAALLRVLVDLGTATLIAYFLLVAGDSFRRTLMQTIGPSMARKRATLGVLADVNVRLQRYLLTLVLSNGLIGLLSWGWFAWVGVEQAAFWGALAGVFHVVPYIGTAMIAIAAAVIGLAQFGTLEAALWLGAGTVLIASVVGLITSSWMQGKVCAIDPAVAIITVTAFAALWGGWGLLLGIPLLAVVKTVGDHMQGARAWVAWLGPTPAATSTQPPVQP